MSERAEEYGEGNRPFIAWLEEIEELVSEKTEMSIFDFEDLLYMDSFLAGETPEEFLREVFYPAVEQTYGIDLSE